MAAIAVAVLVAAAALAAACDDFPTLALENDLDGPVTVVWESTYTPAEHVIEPGGRTSIVMAEGETLRVSVSYQGETHLLELLWSRYSLEPDETGREDFRLLLSSLIPRP